MRRKNMQSSTSKTQANPDSAATLAIAEQDLGATVAEILGNTPFVDIHTHLFAPEMGTLGLWGIDELLTYHYLEAELFRSSPIEPPQYWALTQAQRADLVWRTLFVENPPVSESTRGVIAVLSALGLDTRAKTLQPIREFFGGQRLEEYVPMVFRLAGISSVVMTNDPLDPAEATIWKRGLVLGEQFQAALRIDRIVNEWESHSDRVQAAGYAVDAQGQGNTPREIRRFLETWVHRMQPAYMAVSLPETFQFPAADLRTKILREAVLPCCRDLRIPLALMIGVRRQVNPAIRLAGDASGAADLRALENLCRDYPDNRFLVTLLSRENQHELCVYARKFRNLVPFGCWWFLNNPSIVEEITRERLEMLGTTFIPQHSDARILEQLIYKWKNTRRTLAPILTGSYRLLIEDGRPVTREEIQRDVTRLFRTHFEDLVQRRLAAVEAQSAD